MNPIGQSPATLRPVSPSRLPRVDSHAGAAKAWVGKVRAAMMLVLVMVLTTGCRQRDLCFDHPHNRVNVAIRFDWRADSDASPDGMVVYLFREGARTPYVYDFDGRDGGVVTIPAGSYSALCHNTGSTNHKAISVNSFEKYGLRLGDLSNMVGTVPSVPSDLPGASGQRITYCPEPLWVSSIPALRVEMPEPGHDNDVVQEIVFDMYPAVSQYTFIIDHPVNLAGQMSVTGIVSGLASTVHPGTLTTGEETVCHAFTMRSGPDSTLIGSMLTFGHCGVT